jgi:hypothetical protein
VGVTPFSPEESTTFALDGSLNTVSLSREPRVMVAQAVKSTAGRHKKMLFINRIVKVESFSDAAPKLSVSKNKFTRAAFLTTLQERQTFGAASQPWIHADEQSLLSMRIAATERVVVRADEKLAAFVELEAAIHAISS